MRNVVCTFCNENVFVPDGIAKAHCVRCGNLLADISTAFTADEIVPAQVSSTASNEHFTDKTTSDLTHESANRYSDWDELRTLSPAIQRELVRLATRPLPDLRGAEVWPLPDTARQLANDFGEVLGSIRIPGESLFWNRALGWTALVVAGFILFGLVLLVLAAPLEDLGRAVMFPLLAAAYALPWAGIGIWILFFKHIQLPITLWVFEKGLIWQKRSTVQACPWIEVDDFKVDEETGKPYFAFKMRRAKLEVAPSRDRVVLRLMEFVEIQLTAARLLADLHRVFNGAEIKFGDAVVGRAGISGPRFFAYWAEIERLVVEAPYLVIERRHQREAHHVLYCDVAFPQLVMALARILIEEHARMRPPDA